MTNGHGYRSTVRMSSWVNDINPVNWKTVLVGYMQLGFLVVATLTWSVYVIRNPEKGMQETCLGILATMLTSLSGIVLAGRITDRKTDYGYIERLNQKPPDTPQVIATGDNPTVTATQPAAQAPVAAPVVTGRTLPPEKPPVLDLDDDDGVM